MLQKEVEEHAACAAELESTKTKMVQKQQALQVLQQLQQQFAAVRQAEADCAGLEQQAQQAHQQYYQVEKPKYDAMEQQFFQSMAGNLAAQLQAGAACPVCGSLEHPHPAEQTLQQRIQFGLAAGFKKRFDGSQFSSVQITFAGRGFLQFSLTDKQISR